MSKRKSFAQRLSLIVIALISVLFVGVLAIAAQTCRHLIAEEATKSATNLLDATIADVEKSCAAWRWPPPTPPGWWRA